MTKWAIFDLDSTLCDDLHRRPFALEKKWDEYHAFLGLDKARRAEQAVAQAWYGSSYNNMIAIVTGRPGKYMDETVEWLRHHQIPFDELYMRAEKDFRPNWEHKKEVYENHFWDRDVVFVMEDDDEVVGMWRELGLTCFQVQPGVKK